MGVRTKSWVHGRVHKKVRIITFSEEQMRLVADSHFYELKNQEEVSEKFGGRAGRPRLVGLGRTSAAGRYVVGL